MEYRAISGVKRRQGSGVRCRWDRSLTDEIMDPLDSNVSVSGAVGKREMMHRIAVSVYLMFVGSANSPMSGLFMLLEDFAKGAEGRTYTARTMCHSFGH